MPDWLPRIEVLVLVPLGVALLVHLLCRQRYDIRVLIRGDDVKVTGSVAAARLGVVRSFFRNDFPRRDRLKVLIRKRRDRTFDIRFVPNVSPGERQQVRNFLSTHL